jgi:precorrin-2/cobalt-factor-2 C20-methyltransferase
MMQEALLHITVVGLGPGDPELITVKGLRAIEAADLVFVPRSRSGEESVALQIAQPWIVADRQQMVRLTLPMQRDAAQLRAAWQAAADEIATSLAATAEATGHAAQGVYLLLGDPLLYGTFTYIRHELRARHPDIAVSFIPGVTSFAAAAARCQVALGTAADRVTILPAGRVAAAEQLHRLLNEFETIILMKVGEVMPQVLTALEELDMLDAAVYAERVGMPDERIVEDVRTLRGQRCPYLSLLIIRPGRRGGAEA